MELALRELTPREFGRGRVDLRRREGRTGGGEGRRRDGRGVGGAVGEGCWRRVVAVGRGVGGLSVRLLRGEGRRRDAVRRGRLLLLKVRERGCLLLRMRLLLRVRGDGVLIARKILRRRRREGREAVTLRSAIRVGGRRVGHVGEVGKSRPLLLLDGGKVLALLNREHLLARRRAAIAAVDDLAVRSIRRRRRLLAAHLARGAK